MSAKLFKNTVIYGMGNIVQKLFSFLLVFFYTHFLSPSDIGVINTLQVFSAIYIIFLSFGLERSLYRLYHDYKTDEEQKVFLGTVNISTLVISLLVIGVTLLFKNPLVLVFKNQISFYPLIVLAITDSFFSVLTIVPKMIFQIRGEAVKYLLITVGEAFVGLLCVLAILFIGKRTVYWIMLANIFGYILFLPVYIKIAISNMHFVFKADIFKKILRYSLPIVPSLLSSWIINMSDRIFIEHYYSMADVGLYSVVYKIGQVVQLFSIALLMAYTPMFFKMVNSDSYEETALVKLHNDNILLLLGIFFAVALVSNDFLNLTLTKAYLNVSYIVPVIILGYFFISMIGFQNLSFYQNKNTPVIMVLSLVSAGLNIGFNYLLIKPYGMKGAAIATVITQLVFFIITYIVSLKRFPIRIDFKEFLPLIGFCILVVTIFYKYVNVGWTGLTMKILLLLVFATFLLKFKNPLKT